MLNTGITGCLGVLSTHQKVKLNVVGVLVLAQSIRSLSRGRVMVKQVKSIYPFIVTIVHQHHKRTVGCSIHKCGWVHRCCSCCGCCGRWNLLWKLRILFVNKNYTNICRIVHKISFSPVEFVGTGTNRPTPEEEG